VSKAKHQLLALVLLGTIALTGCGGGGDTDQSSSEAPETRAETKAPTQEGPLAEPKHDAAGQGGETSSAKDAGEGGRDPGTSAPTTTDPLPNEGTKRPAPGVPTNPDGDNSVQGFGTEAPAEDRVEAAVSLQAFLDARATGEWEVACSYLAEGARDMIVKLGERVPTLEGADCARVLEGLSANVLQPTLEEAAQIEVISLRSEENRAYIVYRDSEGVVNAMSMVHEGNGWKLASLAGVPLE